MDPFEVRDSLESLTVLVDTREQDTLAFRRRMKALGCPYIRKKLNYGDYSVRCDKADLSSVVAIERKLDLSELANCYCRERERFTREFERAREDGAKLYLLIERGNWEKAYDGDYRSKMAPSALVASMQAWLARYNCQILFCEAKTTGKLIRDILYRELKEYLEQKESGAADELCTGN